MIGHVAKHRADYAKVVGVFGDLREEFADFDSAFAVSLKSERRSERGAAQAFVLAQFFFAGKRLSMKLIEFWLGIKRVHLRGTAVHKEVNDALGGSWKSWAAGRKRREACRGVGLSESHLAQHACQREAAYSKAGL